MFREWQVRFVAAFRPLTLAESHRAALLAVGAGLAGRPPRCGIARLPSLSRGWAGSVRVAGLPSGGRVSRSSRPLGDGPLCRCGICLCPPRLPLARPLRLLSVPVAAPVRVLLSSRDLHFMVFCGGSCFSVQSDDPLVECVVHTVCPQYGLDSAVLSPLFPFSCSLLGGTSVFITLLPLLCGLASDDSTMSF